MNERWKFAILLAVFLAVYFVPWDSAAVRNAGLESFLMLQEYAREHVLLCLVPAFFIAGAIAVFVSQAAVMKYFGGQAKKILAYSVASVSGTILAVCSCTVLPLFAGIYKRGGRPWSGRCLPLLRSGHQHPGHRAHRPRTRLGNRPGSCGRRGGLRLCGGSANGPDLP